MIYGRIRPPQRAVRAKFTSIALKDRVFALRLLVAMALGLSVCCLLFLVPALFFVEQNYEIFTALAYDVKPALVEHLEREVIWLRFFLAAGSLATVGAGVLFFHRLLRHLLQPLEKVEDHLRSLGEGEWHRPFPGSQDAYTYRTFFIAYENFHHALKASAETELRLLQRLSVEPQNRDSLVALRTLIANQHHKLGLPEVPPPPAGLNESAEESSEVVPFRRVS